MFANNASCVFAVCHSELLVSKTRLYKSNLIAEIRLGSNDICNMDWNHQGAERLVVRTVTRHLTIRQETVIITGSHGVQVV